MKHYLLTIVLGALGALVALAGWHAWQDHVVLHNVVDYLNKAATKAAETAAIKPAEAAK